MIEWLAFSSIVGALGVIAWVARCWFVELGHARAAIRRSEILVAEAERVHRIGQQIIEAQEVSEMTVSVGARLVRTVHKGIAAIPFGILETIPATRDTTRVIRASHDLIAGAVYDSIDAVNREFGTRIRRQLDQSIAEKPQRCSQVSPTGPDPSNKAGPVKE